MALSLCSLIPSVTAMLPVVALVNLVNDVLTGKAYSFSQLVSLLVMGIVQTMPSDVQGIARDGARLP